MRSALKAWRPRFLASPILETSSSSGRSTRLIKTLLLEIQALLSTYLDESRNSSTYLVISSKSGKIFMSTIGGVGHDL